MTTANIKVLQSLERRLNSQAYPLLCEEIARLAAENERLQSENSELRRTLSWAEDTAESWRENAIELANQQAEEQGGLPGLTMNGRMVVVPPTHGAHA
jgi:regulator of replication initiation timing